MAPRQNTETEEDPRSDDDLQTAGSWAQGLSKGVFAHKKSSSKKRSAKSPSRKQSRKKRKVGGDDEMDEDHDKYYSESLACRSGIRVEERVQGYNNIIRKMEAEVDYLSTSMFSDVFEGIVKFVSDTKKSQSSDTIPTAALLTGVNMPDHNKVFNNLISKLGSVTPHVAVLGSGLNLKSLVQQIVVDLSESDSEEGIKKADASFSALEKWYSNQYSDIETRNPLVVVLQDFESSAGSALTDLILLMKRYHGLPFVLIFGVATTITTVHRTLPHSATTKLTINTFGSPPASQLLDQVLEKVIISPTNPFKLSHKVFQFLIENFLFHDFAVQNFLQGYKFIIGEHFYRTPATFLCTDRETALAKLDDLTEEELDSIRRLPSFRVMVEKQSGDAGVKMLVDRTEALKTIRSLLEDFFSQTEVFTVLAKCLYFLVRDLPRKPLGKVMRDVYESAMRGDLTSSEQFKEAWQFLKLASRLDLQDKIQFCLLELQVSSDPRLVSLREKLEESSRKLSDLVEGETSSLSSPAVQSPAVPAVPPSPATTTGPSLPSSAFTTPCLSSSNSPQVGSSHNPPKLDRFKLKAALLQSMKEKQQRSTPVRPFDLVRTELLTCLHSAFTDLLIPPSSLTLHEIFVFSVPGAVRRHLVGTPRAALHAALTDPWEYLDHEHLKIKDLGEIPSTFPDICIGYKLHLECQKLINLYDWLLCWNTISSGAGEDPQADQEAPDQLQQAKFARVVQELQHLGFIRTSTRKTDHVARLTFGGS